MTFGSRSAPVGSCAAIVVPAPSLARAGADVRLLLPMALAVLRLAIANYRTVRKLLRQWEAETERLIESEANSKA